MSIQTPTPTEFALPLPYRFTADRYEQMVRAGVLGPSDHVELIDGEIVDLFPMKPAHKAIESRIARTLCPLLDDQWIVRLRSSIRLDDLSEPQPDIAVARSRPDEYMSAHPQPPDVVLLIEVAQASAAFDRGAKALRYARAGIPEYWIVDLAQQVVDVRRAPSVSGYGSARVFRSGERIECGAIPGLAVDVAAWMRGLPAS